MKFLFVTPRNHPERYFWLKKLHSEGHEIILFVWKLWRTEIENDDVVTSVYVGPSDKINKIAKIFKVKNAGVLRKYSVFFRPVYYYKKLKEHTPDVVVLHNTHLFPISFMTLLSARLQGRKILGYVQTALYKENLSSLKRFFISAVTKVFNIKWITPIKGEENKYPRFNSRAYFIPLVVEPQENPPEPISENDEIRIMTVSKLSFPRKNTLMLLEVLNSLKSDMDFHLTIVGSLPDSENEYFKKIKRYIKDNNLQNRVEIKSNVPPKQMPNEYRKYHIFILPSTDEPFGVSVLEAMAAGLPVICSNTAGVSDYVEDGKNGYTFKDNDLKSLHDTIANITSDRKKMYKMGEKSLQLMKEKYSPEVFYNRLTAVLNSEN